MRKAVSPAGRRPQMQPLLRKVQDLPFSLLAALFKPPAEEFVDLQLAVAEFGPNPFQKGMDFALVKSHDPGGDLNRALVAHETKGPGEHMRAVRVQSDCAAPYVDWFHWAMGAATAIR